MCRCHELCGSEADPRCDVAARHPDYARNVHSSRSVRYRCPSPLSWQLMIGDQSPPHRSSILPLYPRPSISMFSNLLSACSQSVDLELRSRPPAEKFCFIVIRSRIHIFLMFSCESFRNDKKARLQVAGIPCSVSRGS